jgi:hypothetical protein
MARDERLETPLMELEVRGSDVRTLRAARFKRLLTSTLAKAAILFGTFVLGVEAGAHILNQGAPYTYPYCAMPMAMAVNPRARRFIVMLGAFATLGLAIGYWVVGPAYSQADDLTGGTYYGVWSRKG